MRQVGRSCREPQRPVVHHRLLCGEEPSKGDLLIVFFKRNHKIILSLKKKNKPFERHLLLGRKAMTNLESILKSKEITLLTKVHIVKAMFFPVAMYG